jgi:bifunctional DNA-binding transcriptional regulator/antitoxin component of YhaV-PrlF toxin-antitoxin module|tara:strand:- start:208 stop:384 length:177 start_codon:yes stop_codon:yes gene_type:complete
MQKKSEIIFTTIEVDTVSGEYYTIIPEQIINEMGWYEETKIRWLIDGDEIIIMEEKST